MALPDSEEKKQVGGPNDGDPLNPSESAEFDQLAASAENPDDVATSRLPQGRNPLSKVMPFVGRNKKKFAAGGIAGGLVALLISGIIALLPLKIEHMMKNVFSKRFSKIERAYGRRAHKMTYKYFAKRHAGFEPSDAVCVTGGPFHDMMCTWRKDRFEAKLFENQGIKVTEGSDGKAISVEFQRDGKGVKVPANKLEEFLEKGDLEYRDANRFFKKAIREETRWHQIYKRRHLRQSMRNAFGITKWKVFTGKGGEEGKKGVRSEFRSRALAPIKTKLAGWLSCITGDGQCPGDQQPDIVNEDGRKAADQMEQNVNEAIDETIAEAEPENDVPEIDAEAIEKIAQQGGEEISQQAAEELSQKSASVFSKLLASKLVSQIAVKAIPIVGWIDLGAKIDKAITNNVIDQIATEKNSLQYAAVFAGWSTTASNIHDGKKSADEVAQAMELLDGETGDISKAAGYNDVMSGNPVGVKVKGVNGVHGREGTGGELKSAYLANPQIKYMVHPMLVAWNATVGKVLGWLGNILGGIVGFLADKSLDFFASVTGIDVNSLLARAMEFLFNTAFGTVVDGSETGPELFNAIDAGGDVTANQFAKDSGGKKLSDAEVAFLEQEIYGEKQVDRESQNWFTRVASAKNPESVVSRMVIAAPSSPQAAVDRTGRYIASIFSNPFEIFSSIGTSFAQFALPRAYADTPSNLYGVQQYGFTDAELDIDPESLTEERCKEIAEEEAVKKGEKSNICLLDKAVSESMSAWFTYEDDGGL